MKPDKKDDNPFRYCGEYYDKETEEVYPRARYYQPAVGRFLTRDTYTGEGDDPMSLHLYVYCGNDGVNAWDPSGHWGQLDNEGRLRFVHQNITMGAFLFLEIHSQNNKPLYFTNINPYNRIGLSKKELEFILDGSILPDYLKEGKPKGYKWSIKKKSKILGMNLNWKNTFHGKNKNKVEYLKKEALRKFKKSGTRKQKLILLGCVLHSIQDYSAHSYKVDLETVKKRFQKGDFGFSESTLKYHKDVKNYYRELLQEGEIDKDTIDTITTDKKKEHSRYKDNPSMDFVKDSSGEWDWTEVEHFYDNRRYVQAVDNSRDYLRKALKLIK